MRRAQDSTLAARPYSDKLDEVLADVAAVVDRDQHPLLAEEREGTRLIVLFTSDRGMAGSLTLTTASPFSPSSQSRALFATMSSRHGAWHPRRRPVTDTSRDGY